MAQNVYNVFGADGKALYQGNNSSQYQAAMNKQLATLQNPVNSSSANTSSFNLASAGNVALPSWLQANPDDQMHELLQSYAGIGAAFDPTAQVTARNDAIGYNTTAGNQAANNAASEYANRAQQSGASALGAGVVKAQAMLPVFQQNAALKTDAADVAAKAHADAAGLASQIASTIGNLRMSYLNTLTGYVQGQQSLSLDAYKATSANASDAARLAEQRREFDLSRSSASSSSSTAARANLAAATAAPLAKKPLPMQIHPSGLGSYSNLGYAPEFIAANNQLNGNF